ncbi:MAG: UDP-glucose dehydrogenase family protein [Candidatus Limnocylindrales bacterium]
MDPSRLVTVVGAGYVGLVTGVGLASLGRRVHLVETRPDRLGPLQQGRIPLHETGLQDALTSVLAAGLLTVSDTPPDDPGVAMVCVGTPIDDDGRSDDRQLRSALASLHDRFGADAILCVRSTVSIGRTRDIVEWAGLPTAWVFTNPEFLRQGTALADFRHPSRIVVGRFPDADPAALEAILGLYAPIDAPRFIVDVEAAEVIKNAANAFLALKLSFTNEIASLCEEAGADIDDVLAAIGADPRIGTIYMQPSYGFGGSCLPKELRTVARSGQALGLQMHVATAASDANLAAQRRFAERVAAALGGLPGRTIAQLGLAFKAGTDDVRDSPAVALAAAFLDGGATVRAYDPAAGPAAAALLPDLTVVDTVAAAVDGADVVVIATEWPEFQALPWADLMATMARPLLIDGRRLLDIDALRTIGFDARQLGDGRSRPASATDRAPVTRTVA